MGIVTGFASRRGSKAYNQRLSKRRASAVASYLTNSLDGNVAQINANGEEQQVKGKYPVSDAKSRRVEVQIVFKTTPAQNTAPPEVVAELVATVLEKQQLVTVSSRAKSLPVPINLVLEFGYDQHQVSKHLSKALDALTQSLSAYEHEIKVSGFTSTQGTNPYNISLSQRRADAVANYLIRSTNANVAQINAYGEEQQIFDGDSEKNRRVEIEVRFKSVKQIENNSNYIGLYN